MSTQPYTAMTNQTTVQANIKRAGLIEPPPEMVAEVFEWVWGQICGYLKGYRGWVAGLEELVAREALGDASRVTKRRFPGNLKGWKYLREVDRSRQRLLKEVGADPERLPYALKQTVKALGGSGKPDDALRVLQRATAVQLAEALTRIDLTVVVTWGNARGPGSYMKRSMLLDMYPAVDEPEWGSHPAKVKRQFLKYRKATENTVIHELTHFTQELLDKLHALRGVAGMPGGRTPPPGKTHDEKYVLIPSEFYTLLGDQVRKFKEEYHYLIGDEDSGDLIAPLLENWVATETWFKILKRTAPNRWKKAVREFTKAINVGVVGKMAALDWGTTRVAYTPAEGSALSLLEDSDLSFEKLIRMVKREPILFDPVSRQMVESAAVVEVLQRIQPRGGPAPNGLKVYHATTPDHAKMLLLRGFLPETKPRNLTQTYAPGKGLDPGLYVGATARSVNSYGRITLEVTVPSRALEVPTEQSQLGETNPMRALKGHDGAVINGRIPPAAFRVIDGARYLLAADKLPGGLADKKKPSDFDSKALAKGQKVEMEHTSDKAVAREVAMDHLTEDPNYYDKLETIEKHASEAPAWFPEVGDLVSGIETGEGWAYLQFDSGQEVGIPTDHRRGDGWKAAKKFELNVGDPLLMGKYLNSPGRIEGFKDGPKGDPLVIVRKAPKNEGGQGSKKEVKLFKVRYDKDQAARDKAEKTATGQPLPWEMSSRDYYQPFPSPKGGYRSLFHGTSAAFAVQIARQGLDPRKTQDGRVWASDTSGSGGSNSYEALVHFQVPLDDPAVTVRNRSVGHWTVARKVGSRDILSVHLRWPDTFDVESGQVKPSGISVRSDVARLTKGSHREYVEAALEGGLSVPSHVLAEYGLTKTAAKKTDSTKLKVENDAIYVIAPEQLQHLVEGGSWLKKWEKGSFDEAHKLVRQHGGAVFRTDTDGKWDVKIPGATRAPKEDKSPPAAAQPLKRKAFLHLLAGEVEVGTDTASVYALVPEQLLQIITSKSWLKGMKSGDYYGTNQIIRDHGGEVFGTSMLKSVWAEVPGATSSGGLMAPYGTEDFDKAIKKLAHAYLVQAVRVVGKSTSTAKAFGTQRDSPETGIQSYKTKSANWGQFQRKSRMNDYGLNNGQRSVNRVAARFVKMQVCKVARGSIHEKQLEDATQLSKVDPAIAKVMVHSGDPGKDKVRVSKVSLAAANLKPSQKTMILAKSVGMALLMLKTNKVGGELGALISSDMHIMDGHHRWSAAILAGGSSAKVGGYQADLPGKKLVQVLNLLTVGMFGITHGNPGKGNLGDYTDTKVRRMLEDFIEKGIKGKFPWTPHDVQSALKKGFGTVKVGVTTMSNNAKLVSKSVPSWAPARKDMPVLDPGVVPPAAKALSKGVVEHIAPFIRG